MTFPPVLSKQINAQPYPLLFATISGAHLYGFPSPDSDYDLRGVHILSPVQFLGLDNPEETREVSGIFDGIEVDLVTLNESFNLPYLPELIQRKLGGPEQSTLSSNDFEFYRHGYARLRAELQSAFDHSTLPELHSAKPALQDLLLRLRQQFQTANPQRLAAK